MITVDIISAIAIYIFLIVGLVIGKWIFYNLSEDNGVYERSEFLEQCPYCTHLYFDYQRSGLKVCPRCQSYLSVETQERRTT